MIGFAGLSHLGLVSSIATASKGIQVIAYDADPQLSDKLQRKIIPVFEPGLSELLEKSQQSIHFTSDIDALRKCDVVYVSLDVKTTEQNVSDLSALRELIDHLMKRLPPATALVVLSQVPPGFTRALNPGNRPLYYQVETLIFGRAVERALYPERTMVGCADPKAPLFESYAKLLQAFDCPVLPMRYESAELAKISINFYLVSSVSVTNLLAEVCESIGAEWSEIAPSLRLDQRIGPYAYLSPGLGIAGGNLERDLMTVTSLSKEYGTDSGIIDAWLKNSRYRRDWALRKVYETLLSTTKDAQVGIWGLAYKQDTKSTKNSPSLSLIESLSGISLQAFDPQVKEIPPGTSSTPHLIQILNTAYDAAKDVDALVVMTPWKEFSLLDVDQIRKSMRGNIIIDPYGILDSEKYQKNGFRYFRLGTEC